MVWCRWLMACGLLSLAAACTEEANMARQPRADTLQESRFFEDGAVARPPGMYTVSRDGRVFLPGSASAPSQPAMTAELLAKGQRRFMVSCAPCHGAAGYGDGMIVRHGYPSPPSYHIERLREASDAHFYRVLVDGLGKMPAYAGEVPTDERWAVVAYIRALQLSQGVPVERLAEHERVLLEEKGEKRTGGEREP